MSKAKNNEITKKNLDDKFVGQKAHWYNSLEVTLNNVLLMQENKYKNFYQASFIFDRPIEQYKDEVMKFFYERHIHSVCVDFEHSVKGKCGWLVLIALQGRFNKYKNNLVV